MVKTGKLVVLFAFLLAACSSEQEDIQPDVDYASFDNAAVRALYDKGEFEQVHTIIKAQVDLHIADKDDYIILADVFLVLLNGVAAEVALEKAQEAGAEDTEVTLRLARAFMLQREYDDALASLGNVVLTGESAYEAMLIRGDIHRELNEPDRARYFYDAAIIDQIDNFKGYLGLALLELNIGNLTEAESQAHKALELVEDDAIVRYILGATARYQLRPEDAVLHLTKAIELHPAHLLANLELAGIYIDQKDFVKAQEYLDFVYSISPDHALARYHSALILASDGKTEEAENLLLRIGDLTRDFPPAARIYGHVAFQLGKFTTAQPYLQKFLEMVPSDRLTRLALAESLSHRGEPEKALRQLEPLLAGGSDDLEAYMQAAAAAGLAGELIMARDYINKAKILAEANGEIEQTVLTALGRRLALTRFMSGDLERAAEQLRAMYQEDPNDFTSLTMLANLQMEGGDIDGAAETVQQILKIEPELPITQNLMGAVLYRQGKRTEAITHYDKAIELNPDYMSALKNRGLAYVFTQQFEKAQADLEKVLSALPSDAHTQALLGRTYLELKLVDKAIEYLSIAETVFPQSPLILSDHSEALAAKGFMQSAISKAKLARSLSGSDESFSAYLDQTISGWEKAESEKQAQAAAEEAVKREEFLRQRAAKAKIDAERRAAEKADEEKRAKTQSSKIEKANDANKKEAEDDQEKTEDDDPPLVAVQLALF